MFIIEQHRFHSLVMLERYFDQPDLDVLYLHFEDKIVDEHYQQMLINVLLEPMKRHNHPNLHRLNEIRVHPIHFNYTKDTLRNSSYFISSSFLPTNLRQFI